LGQKFPDKAAEQRGRTTVTSKPTIIGIQANPSASQVNPGLINIGIHNVVIARPQLYAGIEKRLFELIQGLGRGKLDKI